MGIMIKIIKRKIKKNKGRDENILKGRRKMKC